MIPADAENPRPEVGPASAWVGDEKGKKLSGKCVAQRWEIISTVAFLYRSWELVEKGEREYDKPKDVVVLEE